MKTGKATNLSKRTVRLGFWIVLLGILILTLSPRPLEVHFLNDKAAHALSFFVLALLGIAAWGRKRQVILAFGLAAIGATIELVQATPLIARDAELLDWAADLTGIVAAVLVFASLAAAYSRNQRA